MKIRGSNIRLKLSSGVVPPQEDWKHLLYLRKKLHNQLGQKLCKFKFFFYIKPTFQLKIRALMWRAESLGKVQIQLPTGLPSTVKPYNRSGNCTKGSCKNLPYFDHSSSSLCMKEGWKKSYPSYKPIIPTIYWAVVVGCRCILTIIICQPALANSHHRLVAAVTMRTTHS